MNTEELEKILRHTLSDMRLSRGEKRILRGTIEELTGFDEHQLAIVRHLAFEVAREQLVGPDAIAVLEWLEEVMKVLAARPEQDSHEAEAYFSPHGDCVGRIRGLLALARSSIDICVFTITDDRITEAILEAVERRVRVRIITDNDKALDPGSDVHRMKRVGVDVRTDRTSDHMHHKYALFDGRRLMTGSYNWTRSASEYNEENFIVTNDGKLVTSFQQDFERLWKELG